MAKYFILFGFIFIIIGVVAGYIAGEWIPVPIGILGGGTFLLMVGLILLSRGFWRRRSTQTGINALVATIALVTILISLNIIGMNYGQTIDLTENNLYTLAPQSQQLVANLEQPLQVFVFESPAAPENERLLETYQSYSENFEFEFVDPQQDIAKVESFGVESYGEVYIEYGDKTQFVQQVSEFEPLSEVELTNAINIIQRDRVSFAYFLQGHGEPPLEEVQGGLSQAVNSLEQQGYQIEPFNFAEETTLPSSPNSVLIIVSPQQNLFPGEIEAIQDYVADGGHLFFLLDRESSDSLEPLLDLWGIELDDRVIVDASGRGEALGFNAATALVTNYGDHPITNPLENGISVYPLSRPVDVREMPRVEATPLAFTNEESWAESDLTAEQLEYDPDSDRAGPLVLAFALERTEVTDAEVEDISPEQSQEESPNEDNEVETEELPNEALDNNADDEPVESNETTPEQSQEESPNEDNEVETEELPNEALNNNEDNEPVESDETTPGQSQEESSDEDNEALNNNEDNEPVESIPPSERTQPSLNNDENDLQETEEEEESSENTVNNEETQPERNIIPPSDRVQPSPNNEENDRQESEESPETPEASLEDNEETEDELELPEPNLDSRVVIFGNSEFAKNGLFTQQLNGDIFLNSVDWLVSSEENASLGLRPTEETNRRINLTTQQANILRNVALLVVPLFGVVLAIISWLRRR